MINFFKNKEKTISGDNDSLCKITALLIHAAKIDENYEETEKDIIKKTLIEIKLDLIENLLSNKKFILENNRLAGTIASLGNILNDNKIKISNLLNFVFILFFDTSKKNKNKERNIIKREGWK